VPRGHAPRRDDAGRRHTALDLFLAWQAFPVLQKKLVAAALQKGGALLQRWLARRRYAGRTGLSVGRGRALGVDLAG
jgi:hypothetical protein